MIELTEWLREELIRRADRETPLECCGLISLARELRGNRKGKIALWEAENAAESPETSFAISPQDQFGILKQIKLRGEDLVGVYHSHPRSGPEPSERDRAVAATFADFWPGLTWVIVGVATCPNCGGAGVIDGMEPTCCGNTTSSGECRGDCVVPRQVEEPCPCGGDPPPAFWAGQLP